MKSLLYREDENNMTTKRTFFSLRKLTIGLIPVTFAVLATVHTKHVRADAQDELVVANVIKEEAQPTETPSNDETTNETNVESNTEPTEASTSVENISVSTSTTETLSEPSEETDTTSNLATTPNSSKVGTTSETSEAIAKEDVIDWNKVIYEVGEDMNVAITDYTYEAADLEKEWTVLLPNTYDFIQKGIIDENHIATISSDAMRKIVLDRSTYIPGTNKIADKIAIKVSENGDSKLKISDRDLYFGNEQYEFIKNLAQLDLSNLDTEEITDIRSMFEGSNLEKLDLSGWNTSNAVSSFRAFAYSKKLTHLDISNWSDEGPGDISYMLNGLTNLRYLNISNWNWNRIFIEIEDRNVLQTSPNLEVLMAENFKNLTWPIYYKVFLWFFDPKNVPPIEEVDEHGKYYYNIMRNYFAFQSNHPLIIIAPDDFGDRSAWSDDSNPELKRPTEINLKVNFVAEGTSEAMKADLENFMFPSIDDLNNTIDQKIRAAVGEKVDLTKYDLTYEIPVSDAEIEKDPATLIRKLTGTYQVKLTHKFAQSTESKTVKRTITVITPNKSTKEIIQEAVFTRNVSKDLVTEQSTFTNFVSQDGHTLSVLPEYIPATIPGYTPSIPKVDALEVTGDSTPEDVTITYKKVETNTSIDENKPAPTPTDETPTTEPTSDTTTTETTETTEEKLTISDDNNEPETETKTSEEKLVVKQNKQSKAKVNKISQLANKVRQNQTKSTETKATLPQTGKKQTALFVGLSVLLASLGLFTASKKKTEE